MINSLLRWIGLFILVYVLQTTIVPVISIFGAKPDLLMVVLFFLGIKKGGIPAVFTGFLIGLTQDFYSPQLLGQNALAKSIIGYFAGLFDEKVMRLDPFMQIILLFTMFILHDVVYLGVEVLQNGASLQSVGTGIVTMTLPRALYSIVFALVPIFRDLLFTSDHRR